MKEGIRQPYPLDILAVGGHYHGWGHDTKAIIDVLENDPNVRKLGTVTPYADVMSILRNGSANTIFLDPWYLDRVRGSSCQNGECEVKRFVGDIRKAFPGVVFVLYGPGVSRPQNWLQQHSRFSHYFRLTKPVWTWSKDKEFDEVLRRCQAWHMNRYDFDVTLSFAGEDRMFARELARELVNLGARVFFDEFYTHEVLGKDLYAYLHEAYSSRARYCIALISKYYVERIWTLHELRSAQERALKQGTIEYLLPVRLDPTDAPGLMSTVAYINGDAGASHVARTIGAKLWPTSPLAAESFGAQVLRKIQIGESVDWYDDD